MRCIISIATRGIIVRIWSDTVKAEHNFEENLAEKTS